MVQPPAAVDPVGGPVVAPDARVPVPVDPVGTVPVGVVPVPGVPVVPVDA